MEQKKPILMMDTIDGVEHITVCTLEAEDILEEFNGEKGFHIYHVCLLTELLLRQLQKDHPERGLTEEAIVAISTAAALHDIGKRRVPKSILDNPGRLSPVEYDIVKKHAVFGEAIIREHRTDDVDVKLLDYAAQIARSHHERYDGTGYPDGLVGEAIPLCAHVVALADAYDALTSNRSYKDAFSQDVAIQMIAGGMCGVFDEELLACLFKVVNHSTLTELREWLNRRRSVVESVQGTAPKRVLCIGNTAYLTDEFLETAFPGAKVTVIGGADLEGKGSIKLFRVKKPSIRALFETYEFDAVVYFSGDLTYRTMEKSDSEELREVLEFTVKYGKDTRLLYLSTLDAAFREKNDRAIVAEAKERLCDFYGREYGLDVKVVRIPYLYSGVREGDFLYRVFEQAKKQKLVQLEDAAGSTMHFLSMHDLSELVARLMDGWRAGTGALTVNEDFDLTFADLAAAIPSVCGDVKVEFLGTAPAETLETDNRALRGEYGWFSKISLIEDLDEEYARYTGADMAKRETLLDKIRAWLQAHPRLLKTTELVLFFLVMELLLFVTHSSVIFSGVDFRLVYIVVMATVHGLYYGIAASTLAGLSYLAAKVASGMSALTIFYEPTNWLPFVFFYLVGALCGYVKLRYDDKIRTVSEQNRLLEDKLVFTREIYEDTYREKRDLKKQIIGSRDSFGKIFDITRRLNTVEPQRLYLRIMETFEEVLENKGITVYSVNENSRFGRLEVASRDIIENVSRSISLDTYRPIVEVLDNGEIWRNVELIPEFPMYAAGVYRGGKLVLVIFLWHADLEQRSLYYVNLFRILRDLVEMSLLRAYDYNQALIEKQFLPGTHIMNAEAFADCLKNFAALAERKVSSYLLLEVDGKGRSYRELDELLSRRVRANDFIGAAEDGKVRVLLSQATERDLEFILPRFAEDDVIVTVLS